MRWGRALAVGLWLTVLWMLLWADAAPGTLVGGVAIAAVVMVIFARGVARRSPAAQAAERPKLSMIGLVIYLAYVVGKIVQSNVILAWRIIGPRYPISPGVVRVPLLSGDSLTMVMAANAITLTPGTLTIETSSEPPVLYVSALYAHDVEALRRELLAFERYAIRAAGSPTARARLADVGREGTSP
jgi:multicomponent Na+:H+ antiporter subunit E